MTVKERTKPQVATMNAVHDLPVLVARDTSSSSIPSSTARSTRSTTKAASTSTACANGGS